MKGSDNTCICCGCLIPEGRQICPKCSSESHCFEQVMSRPVPAQPDFKVDDTVEQAYRRGYAAGLKDNKKLLREALSVIHDAFFANHKVQNKADKLYCRISQILEEE